MLVRCNNHPSKTYSHSARPVGYPHTAAICGRCDRPGMLLLNDAEWKAYQAGQTAFSFNSNIMQVEAESYASSASAR